MPLNSTMIIRDIERRFGVSHHALELTDEGILDTIKQVTLPIFSNYFPYMYRMKIDPERDRVETHTGVYWIKTEMELLGVNKLLINNFESNQAPLGSYYNDPFGQVLFNTMTNISVSPTTFMYRPPNQIEIFPKNLYYREMLIELKVVHPEHLQTIPVSLYEEFKNLAFYDICLSIFPIRGRYTNISTSFGNIDLFMNQLEDAQSRRDDLLERWRRDFIKSPYRKKIYIY